jgi:predicted transcriptional regulator
MTRQDLLDIVEALPDDTPFDLVADELRKARVVAEIKAGLDEIARGETVSHEEMKRRAAEWKRRR